MTTQVIPDTIQLVAGDAAVEIIQAAGGGKSSIPRILGVAYSGVAVRPLGWGRQVITDTAGLELPNSLPILASHENEVGAVVGQGRPYVQDGKIFVEGVVSRANAAGRAVLQLAADGVQLQLSLGAAVHQTQSVEPGKNIFVNNQSFMADSNGLTIVRKATLREITITPIGADAATWAEIKQKFEGNSKMSTDTKKTNEPANLEQNLTADELRAAAATEAKRVAAIHKTCIGHPDIEVQAIEQGWEPAKAELMVFRAARPAGPAIHGGGGDVFAGGETAPIEAALLCCCGKESLATKNYGEAVVARGKRMKIQGLADAVRFAANLDGVDDCEKYIRQSAGFSTSSLSTLLGNTANKVLLESYRAFQSAARKIAKKLSAADFKTHTGLRMANDPTLERVAANSGELKHGSLGESSFTYAVDTYGKIFGVTRQMIINDDLGAFLDIPAMLGRGAALAVEKCFMTLLLANTGLFFHDDNSNYISGSTVTLGVESLGSAIAKFRQQVDGDGNPIVVEPKFLLVPPELESMARRLVGSAEVRDPAAETLTPTANPFAGWLEVVVSPYLSNSNFSGHSATAWYLFGDPADVPAFGIAYLDGVETPVIEDAPLPGDLLGKAWRGYIDFGVCQIDHRGAVMSKGAA